MKATRPHSNCIILTLILGLGLILTGLGDLYSEVEEFDAAAQAYNQAGTVAGRGASPVATLVQC